MLVAIVDNQSRAFGKRLGRVLVTPDVDCVWQIRGHGDPRVEVLVGFGDLVAVFVQNEGGVVVDVDFAG